MQFPFSSFKDIANWLLLGRTLRLARICEHFFLSPLCVSVHWPIQDQAKAMDHFDERVRALQKRGLQVLPLKFRRETPQKLLPVEALCEFDTEEVLNTNAPIHCPSFLLFSFYWILSIWRDVYNKWVVFYYNYAALATCLVQHEIYLFSSIREK